MAGEAISLIPESDGNLVEVPYGTNRIRPRDLVRWASGVAKASAAGEDSQTDATLFHTRIGFSRDDSDARDQHGGLLNPTVRVAIRGRVWLKKNNTTAPTLGQYVMSTDISSATEQADYESSASATNALGVVVGWASPYMLVQFDFTGAAGV